MRTVKEIEKCCVEWRAGRVEPRLIFLIDSKPTGSARFPPLNLSVPFFLITSDFDLIWCVKRAEYGCALQIKLSLHLFLVCSVDVIYPSFEIAKAACAADALLRASCTSSGSEMNKRFEPRGDFLTLRKTTPRPLDCCTSSFGRLTRNLAVRLFSFISPFGLPFEEVSNSCVAIISPLGLAHGAVLRLTRPGEVRTCIVDHQFPKRGDAKNTLCLVALAAGVGGYVRAVSGALETKISPEMKTIVFESIFPLLMTEYAKFGQIYYPNV